MLAGRHQHSVQPGKGTDTQTIYQYRYRQAQVKIQNSIQTDRRSTNYNLSNNIGDLIDVSTI